MGTCRILIGVNFYTFSFPSPTREIAVFFCFIPEFCLNKNI